MIDINGGMADPSTSKRTAKDSPGDSAPLKRSRVSRACDQCRSSREKCDGAQPTCATCTSQKRSCTYNEQPKKRGIQPNYIRTLELTLAWAFRTFPDTEKRLSNALPNRDSVTQKLISGKDAAASESLHQAWRNGLICRQIDQMLSGAAVDPANASAPDAATYQSPPLSAPSDYLATNDAAASDDLSWRSARLLQQSLDAPKIEAQPDPINRRDGRAYTGPGDAPVYLSRTDTSRSIRTQGDASTGYRLQLPSDAWTLLEYFFAFTHSWLPLTDKQATLKLMYTFPADGMLLEEASKYAELWSIFALAKYQMSTDHSSTVEETLEKEVTGLIPNEVRNCDLGQIRALLLLGLIRISRQDWGAAWMRVGSAVRRLLYLKSTHAVGPELPGDNAVVLVTLAAFVLETCLAARLSAPAHLTLLHLGPDQVIEDGLEEWGPWHDPLNSKSSTARTPSRSFSTFNRVVRAASLRYRGKGYLEADNSHTYNLVYALAQNAQMEGARMQPLVLVTEYANATNAVPATQQGAPRSQPLPPAWTNPRPSLGSSPGMDRTSHGNLPFMSIPTDTSDTASQQSPYVGNPASVGAGPAWASTSHRPSLDPPPAMAETAELDNALSGVDIFEELAMLERTESTQDPQFMQNLGFAPDLDLAEFFGPDYQPSDPLLAYMHPTAFGGPPGVNQRNGDAG